MWMSSVWCQLAAESALDGHYTAQNCCSCLRRSPHTLVHSSFPLSLWHALPAHILWAFTIELPAQCKSGICVHLEQLPVYLSFSPCLPLSALSLLLSLRRGTHKSWKVYLNIQKRTNFCFKCSTIVKAQTVEEKLQQRRERTACTITIYSVKVGDIYKYNIYMRILFFSPSLPSFPSLLHFVLFHYNSVIPHALLLPFTGYQTKHSH